MRASIKFLFPFLSVLFLSVIFLSACSRQLGNNSRNNNFLPTSSSSNLLLPPDGSFFGDSTFGGSINTINSGSSSTGSTGSGSQGSGTVIIGSQVAQPRCQIAVIPITGNPGSSRTLLWQTEGVVGSFIFQGAPAPAQGAVQIRPLQTQVFTAMVSGPGGTFYCSAPLYVTPGPLDPFCIAPLSPEPATPSSLVQKYNWNASGSTSSFNQVMAAPVVGPLMNEDMPSIVTVAFKGSAYTTNAYVYAIDGRNGSQQWVHTAQYAVPGISPAIGNIHDSSGNEALFLGVDNYVYALSSQGTRLWKSSQGATPDIASARYVVRSPILADFNADGEPDVMVGPSVFRGSNGAFLFKIEGAGVETIARDVRPEPGVEIISSEGVHLGTDGSFLCQFSRSINVLAAAKLRDSDSYYTAIGKNGASTLIAYRLDNCSQLYESVFPGTGGGPINIADFNKDGILDYGTGGKNRYATFDGSDGSKLWDAATEDDSSLSTGSTSFDLNGDGRLEIIYSDEHYLRIFDSATGSVLAKTANPSGTLYEYPLVVDVDNNGHADIVVAANNYAWGSFKGIRVFTSPTDDWAPTRPIWNQHGFYTFHVANDGTIFEYDPERLLIPGLESSHLIGFRNNVPMRKIKQECR